MPQLQDPNFVRSVVLLVHHDEDGTFGLVLNREAEIRAVELCASLGLEWRGDDDAEVGIGGPVQPQTGWVLFGEGGPSDREGVTRVLPGVFCAGSIEVLRELTERPVPEVRLFLGYAGWAPGQLEGELAAGAWLVAPATREVVFAVAPAEMWTRVLRDLGVDPATLVATPGIH